MRKDEKGRDKVRRRLYGSDIKRGVGRKGEGRQNYGDNRMKGKKEVRTKEKWEER